MKRRVVVTGMGCLSPVGNSVLDSWKSVCEGRSGISHITLFDTSRVAVKIAGEVKNFDLQKFRISKKSARKMARFSQFCLATCNQALEDAGISVCDLQKEKCGVIIGCCLGGTEVAAEGFKKIFDPASGPDRISPLTTPLMITNEAAANICIAYNLHCFSWTIGTACASGTDAIGISAEMIRGEKCDICITGGTDASITEFSISSYFSLQALCATSNDAPQKASRPFSKGRNGFVVAEGSAILILEEFEHAKNRGAKIYAEVVGYGSSCDAYHITSPLKDGSGAALAVNDALKDAGISANKIQYYNAHGTSTIANDIGETAMLKSVFGEHARKMFISSTKSMTGHLIGAAGALESIFCIMAINDGFVPPTINLDEPDIEGGCDLNYTPNVGISTKIEIAANGSLGFGGHNACLIFKKIEM